MSGLPILLHPQQPQMQLGTVSFTLSQDLHRNGGNRIRLPQLTSAVPIPLRHRRDRERLMVQVTQAKAVVCRTRGWDEERIANELWLPQHERAGERMYRLCIDLRGFYLKV